MPTMSRLSVDSATWYCPFFGRGLSLTNDQTIEPGPL